MQRAVNELVCVHRQRTLLGLPVAAAQGEVAQVKIEAGDRPVRPLQAGVGYIKAANL